MRCPITYEICEKGQRYTLKGLHLLSKSLTMLKEFPYTSKEQIELAAEYSDKLSIQGVQPKLSIVLNEKRQEFEVVESGGMYILKPPHHIFQEVPQNEDLTMRLAKVVGMDIPLHGMMYNKDGSFSYFIKRFDRKRKQKIAVEDFSQLLNYSRDTKYDSSMEQVVNVIDEFCTYPVLEKIKLFKLVVFNFLVGNEDMHLKNFSLIKDMKGGVSLSPCYDLLNTTILLKNVKEEIALPIGGKKSNLKRRDIVEYYGGKRLELSEQVMHKELLKFEKVIPEWKRMLADSFLSIEMRVRYESIIDDRWRRLNEST